MRKFAVLYFTRTKNSQRVAEKIAQQLSCKIFECTDNINWQGLFGYLKAGFYSMTDRQVEVEIPGDVGEPQEYIIVGPYWAGGLAPALKALLNQFPREKVHLVVNSIGSHVKDRDGYLSVHDITSNSGNVDAVIADLVTSLLEGGDNYTK